MSKINPALIFGAKLTHVQNYKQTEVQRRLEQPLTAQPPNSKLEPMIMISFPLYKLRLTNFGFSPLNLNVHSSLVI